MNLKNSQVQGLANFLVGEKLSGKCSRMRTRFVKVLNERLKEIDEFRIELLNKHSKKDDEGQPIIKDNAYVLEDQKAFNEEYAELMNEDFVIDETESKREMLQHVKAILEKTETEFDGLQAFQYDEWCEAFENLKYEDKTKSE